MAMYQCASCDEWLDDDRAPMQEHGLCEDCHSRRHYMKSDGHTDFCELCGCNFRNPIHYRLNEKCERA